MLWMAVALAGNPTLTSVVDGLPPSLDGRVVCDLQLMEDGRALVASGTCGDQLLTAAAGAFEPDPVQSVGMWPHPALVLIDGVELQNVRVVNSRRGARLRPRAAARVQRWAGAQISGPQTVVACDVAVLVAENGAVEAAEPVDCPVRAEVVSAAMAWQFRPLMVRGEAVSFEAFVVVPVASADTDDTFDRSDIEAFELFVPASTAVFVRFD